MKIKALVVVLGAAFAMNAMAQHPNFSKFMQRKNIAAPLQACVASNAKLDAEIDALFKKEKAAGLIDPAEEKKYLAMEATIKKHQDALAKDGFSAADCAAMTKDYQAEKAAVVAMGARVTPLRACQAKNAALDKEVDGMFAKAKAGGQIDKAEEATFAKMEANIKKHRAALQKGGFTLADCNAMTKDYENEKAAVTKMAAAGTAKAGGANELAACRADNAKVDKEIDALFAAAKKAGKISPTEEKTFKAAEAKIAKHRAALAKDGFTLADCKVMAKDYAAEKALVTQAAANSAAEVAAFNACVADNNKVHSANLADMAKARAAKKVTPAEEAEFKKFEAAASKSLADMKKDGYTVADCKARAKDLAAEKALIAKVAK